MAERKAWIGSRRALRSWLASRLAMLFALSLVGSLLLSIPGDPAASDTSGGTGEIQIYAGGAGQVSSARGTSLDAPRGLAFFSDGEVTDTYFAESGFHRIRKVNQEGVIETIAGTGDPSSEFVASGTATSVGLSSPSDVAVYPAGNGLLIADKDNHSVRKLDFATEQLTILAGTGQQGSSGDGTSPLAAKLNAPESIAFHPTTNNPWIADTGNGFIWEIRDGQLRRILNKNCATHPITAQEICLSLPSGIAFDSLGILYIADRGSEVIFSWDGSTFEIEAGDPDRDSTADGKALETRLREPHDVVPGDGGVFYIADTGNHAIRKVDASQNISTVAGVTETELGAIVRDPRFSPYVEAVPGTEVGLNSPRAVTLDLEGNIVYSDTGNNRVRQVNSEGLISTAIGLSCCFFKGDGGLALDAQLNEPEGVSVSKGGDICLADRLDHRVRCIDGQGVITSEIGTGIPGGLPFEVPAGLALLNGPTKALFDDARGIMYISNNGGAYIAKVEDGIYSIVARFQGGDEIPQDLTVDSSGAVYAIVHTQSNGMKNIFRMDPANGYVPISILKGACVGDWPEGSGNPEQFVWETLGRVEGTSGGPIRCPGGLVSDKDDNLYISDGARHVVWMAQPRSTCQSPTVLGYCLKVFAGKMDEKGNDDDSSFPKATDVRLDNPASLAIDDDSRNLYLNDAGNGRIRKVDLITGAISTVAGGGNAEVIYGESSLLARIHAYLEWRNTPQGGELILSGLKGKFRAARIDLSTTTPTVTPLAGGGKHEQAAARPAIESILQRPADVVEGPTGTVYVADALGNRILAIDPGSSEMYEVKGAHDLSFPRGVAVDELGQFLFVSEEGKGNITKVNLATGATTTVASGLIAPSGIAVRDGAVYFAETGAHIVRKFLLPNGPLVTIAGKYKESDETWDCNYCGFAANGLANQSTLWQPRDVALDEGGNIYIADTGHAAVQRVDKNTGEIRTIHTHPTKTRAKPYGVAIATGGDPLFVAYGTPTDEVWQTASDEWLNGTRIAGNCPNHSSYCPLGDGGQSQDAALRNPANVSVGLASGVLYIADEENNRIRRIEAPVSSFARIATIAGAGPTGDREADAPASQGKASEANLGAPEGIASFANGLVTYTYIADTLNHRVRRVDNVTGYITTVAGTGIAGYSGEGPATQVQLNNPEGLAVDKAGNLYVADTYNHRIRTITPSGTISTVAGDGKYLITVDGELDSGPPEDGELATNASLRFPRGVALDYSENLLIAETGNHLIRIVDKSGIIRTLAGKSEVTAPLIGTVYGIPGYADGPARIAQFDSPEAIAVALDGSIYVADTGDRVNPESPTIGVPPRNLNGSRIRKIDERGFVTTIWYKPNSHPEGITLDTQGNLYIAASSSLFDKIVSEQTQEAEGVPAGNKLFPAGNKIYKITPQLGGSEEVIAGNGLCALVGDGGLATDSTLCGPSALAIGEAGDLFIADSGNNMIRRIVRATTGHLPFPKTPQIPPSDSTLSETNPTYSWSGQVTTHSSALFGCSEPSTVTGRACDEKRIALDPPAGVNKATLRVAISADLDDVNDFDFIVVGPDGNSWRSEKSGNEDLDMEITTSGTYIVQVRAWTAVNASYQGLAELKIPPKDFSLSVSPTSRSIGQEQSTTYSINVDRSGGHSAQVSLSVTGIPEGATSSFSPNPVDGSTSTLTVTTTGTTSSGTYSLAITGNDGTLTRSTSASLTVSAPDFSLSASPQSRSIDQGSSTTYDVSVSRLGGHTAAVTLAVSGLPSGASGSFNPNPVSGTASTLHVTATGSTPVGTYSLTISGGDGAVTRTTQATLVINYQTAGRTVTRYYLGGLGDLGYSPFCGIGGVCFDVLAAETSVTLTIQDDLFVHVAAYYVFRDASFNFLSDGYFCDSKTVEVPPGSRYLRIYPEEAFSTLDCAAFGGATSGSVTGEFR